MEKYLFRLCGVEVPVDRKIDLSGVRLSVVAHWQFTDGNVSWALRKPR